jgi:hypothetical protein
MLEGQQKRKLTGVSFVAFSLLSALALLFFLPSQVPAQPVINWNPGSLNETLKAGESKTLSVSFVATANITNANLRVVPALESYVRVTPSNLGNITKGQLVEISLSIETDAMDLPQVVDGVIQLQDGDGKSTFPKPLPVSLTILWNTYFDDTDRYQIEYPPVLQPVELQLLRPSFLHGIVFQSPFEMLNLSIVIYENPSFIPVDQWYSQRLADKEYSFPDGATRSVTQIIFNGIPSLQVNSTILGFVKRRIFISLGDRVIGLESSVPENAGFPTEYFEMINSFSIF